MIEDGVTTVAISPNGEYVAAGSLDKSVRVWDIRSGNLIARLDGPDGHKDSVYSVAFGPDGETLVSGSLDKTIKMWQLSPDNRGMMGAQMSRGGRLVRTFEGHKVSFLECSAHSLSVLFDDGSRTLFLALRSRQMANGCLVGPKTEAYSSGIPGRVTRN